jgi:hypothetical protein
MPEREIRIRGANDDEARRAVLTCIDDYESGHLNDGRGEGLRNCVVWSLGRFTKASVAVYHTKTAIVGLYRGDDNG